MCLKASSASPRNEVTWVPCLTRIGPLVRRACRSDMSLTSLLLRERKLPDSSPCCPSGTCVYFPDKCMRDLGGSRS
jgi:hypothetical protein